MAPYKEHDESLGTINDEGSLLDMFRTSFCVNKLGIVVSGVQFSFVPLFIDFFQNRSENINNS
ncbi:hypothetical protein C1645_837384 [Glomus cerebriforme]|uniref:Uncharacterized protein n=1 Tax=Glomus cerebriforme TaxID=658196 RepID=A0A397SEL7_9GLOM|nr:hypothetical protein C1645_837384 [Glomus cerebriforme]